MTGNKLCQVLNIEKPIIQGPMSWTSTAPLVAAVSEAGGFGVLGTAVAPAEFIREQIRETKKRTNKPFGFNMGFHPMVLDEMYFDQILDVIKTEKPAAVHLDALCNIDEGFAEKCFTQWHEVGIKIMVKVFTRVDLLIAQRAGADVIIVKGWEGGGHLTAQTTMVLVPLAADSVTVPLVASGGIADGRGMAAALALGADGIEMGTIFLAAQETAIHDKVKQAVIQAGDMTSVDLGASANQPCRQLRNRLSERVLKIEAQYPKAIAGEKIKEMVGASLRKAMVEGDIEDEGAIMAGQIVPLVKQIRPVAQIIDETIDQYRKVLAAPIKF